MKIPSSNNKSYGKYLFKRRKLAHNASSWTVSYFLWNILKAAFINYEPILKLKIFLPKIEMCKKMFRTAEVTFLKNFGVGTLDVTLSRIHSSILFMPRWRQKFYFWRVTIWRIKQKVCKKENPFSLIEFLLEKQAKECYLEYQT